VPDITLVLFHSRLDELEDTFASLAQVRAEFSRLWILVSGSNQSAAEVRAALARTGLDSHAVVQHRHDNLGFASGHNKLIRDAFTAGADSVLVLNPDVSIEPAALLKLAAIARRVGSESLYGPTLARRESRAGADEVFDSAGIGWSATARHFDMRQGARWVIQPEQVETVAGVTGACLFVPHDAYQRILERTGQFFDDAFLAYREDAELGVRAGLVGVRSHLVHISGFSHVRSVRGYQRGSVGADLLGVKNRFLIRWKLGKFRPGSVVGATARDLAVVLAVLVNERTSLPGLKQSFAIRRYERHWGRHLEEAEALWRPTQPTRKP
jgi:GT2 family glycosyltransferase